MCGRYTLTATSQAIAQHFELETFEQQKLRYNIAPSQSVLVVKLEEQGEKQLTLMHWGLIPNWVKDLDQWKANLINARAETVDTKPSFRAAYSKRHCLIPATGFYEWCNKQPYYLSLKEGELFAFAGLWETWQSSDGKKVDSCTIITTQANSLVAKVHSRMPVIIDSRNYDTWLNDSRKESWKQLLQPYPEEKMQLRQVSKSVNNPRYDQLECIEGV